MKRLRRIILNALTVFSLVLCVATVVLWVRSYWRADSFWLERKSWQNVVLLSAHSGGFTTLTLRNPTPGHFNTHTVTRSEGYYPVWGSSVGLWRWRLAGFEYVRNKVYRYDIRSWTAPIALLTLITSILPSMEARRIRRNRHLRDRDVCRACRYDLTGNVSGVCPECGTTVAKG